MRDPQVQTPVAVRVATSPTIHAQGYLRTKDLGASALKRAFAR